MFGIELHAADGAVMIVGLANAGGGPAARQHWPARFAIGWLASLAVLAATPLAPMAFMVLGVIFGLAFLALGLELLSETKTGGRPACQARACSDSTAVSRW